MNNTELNCLLQSMNNLNNKLNIYWDHMICNMFSMKHRKVNKNYLYLFLNFFNIEKNIKILKIKKKFTKRS